MRALITRIVPWHPTKVRLQWELESVSESGVFTYDVERSGSPGGPWTTIETGLANTYVYDDMLNDEEANTLSLVRDIYYRIKVVPPSGAPNTFYSPIVNLDGLSEHEMVPTEAGNPGRPVPSAQFGVEPLKNTTRYPVERSDPPPRMRLLKRKMMRDLYLQLQHLNGVNFALLKRRHFGVRCSCYDPITRVVLISGCPDCYGTSWVGGYFTPVYVLGHITETQIQTSLSPQAKDDVTFTPKIKMLDFPKIDEGDILVERQHNRRFLVMARYNTTLKTITVHQTLSVSELPRSAPEYDVSVELN